jgi:hypothetical protein
MMDRLAQQVLLVSKVHSGLRVRLVLKVLMEQQDLLVQLVQQVLKANKVTKVL